MTRTFFQIFVGCGLVLAAALLPGRAPAQQARTAPRVDGVWKWSFTMPDGSRIEPRVTLRQDGERLTGTARFRPDTDEAIRNGILQDDQVSFQVVRERDGRKVTTTYRGRVSGETLKGTIESDWSGEKRSYPWEARHASADATGAWKWTMDFGWWQAAMTLRLKQDGEKLTGTLQADSRRESEIKDGKFHKSDLSFTVEQERTSGKRVHRYRGRVDGDLLTGTIDVDWGTNSYPVSWRARRVSDEKEPNHDQ